ncbi:MAG: phosphoesterase [Bacteroidales bacterium]|jgi:exonuclease SbcD|nr:phosphoesterase [Bacteroidales bacterium]
MANIKTSCALLMNDVHVSKDNISEFHKNWDEALSICDREDISDLIIGGDLWESRASQTLNVLLAVREALIKAKRAGIFVTIAAGNHCKVDQELIVSYSHIFSEYSDVTIIDEFACYNYQSVHLYTMSYFPENGSFIDRFNVLKEKLDNSVINILYIHEGINGALANVSDKELPTNIFSEFDKVLVGHYHNRCKIKGTNIEYIGSSRQFNFGEDEEKGYTILFDDGSAKFVKNQVNIRYKVVEVAQSELDDDFYDEVAEITKDPLYRVKAKIICKEEEASLIDQKQLLNAGISKIDIISEDILPEKISSSGLDSKFDKNGIRREYVSFCEEKEITSVELGLKYLDKIN